ncbi:MAG TPA: hypothetical protein VG873_03505 [Burkholderiales bacterium]|nr:hypothetical protein [Burkholderiales bacterium]
MVDVYRRAIERVIEICGGAEAAAVRLNVDAQTLKRWQRGLGQPGTEVFLRCVDIILNEATLPELRGLSKRRDIPPR